MGTKKRNWSRTSPFTMWRNLGLVAPEILGGTVSKTAPLPKVRCDGARIHDKDTGLIYEAVIERENGQARLTGLTILTTQPGQRIDKDVMRSIAVQRIAEQVSLHLDAQEDAGMPAFGETLRSKHDGPKLEQVADDYRAGLSRSVIAAKYLASPYTIDKRIREARDQGLIPPARIGRKRSTKTSEPSGSGTSN